VICWGKVSYRITTTLHFTEISWERSLESLLLCFIEEFGT
jgi:hypothetical protein